MEPEGSLPCLQVSPSGPCSQPDHSSPYQLTLYLQPPVQYYTPTYALVFTVVSGIKRGTQTEGVCERGTEEIQGK
jgi:hypothetical protein